MDEQKSKLAVVSHASDGSTRGGQTKGSSKKAVTSDSPALSSGKPEIKRGRQPPSSINRFAWMKKGTGRQLKTIDSSQLEASRTPISSSTGFELLCTYNWVSTPSPTIYVPGGPAQWKPLRLPTTLPKDSGTQFVDQNAFRAPTYPFEPMFAALDLMKPDFNFSAVDLVTNRNSLRRLLDFAAGRARDSFRIDVDLVQNTLFLTRRERDARIVIRGSQNTGYGHNFERAFTEPQIDLEESSGHHRVARYMMGELDCAVRFEVDAYCRDDEDREGRDEEHVSGHGGTTATAEADTGQGTSNLLTEFTRLSLAEDPGPKMHAEKQEEKATQKTKKIDGKFKHALVDDAKGREKAAPYKATRVIQRGRAVACSTLAEIKAKKTKARLAEVLPQLWFGRTPLLLHATHVAGTFVEQVEEINAGELFHKWETGQQEVLRKMVSLIGHLKSIASEAKGGACVVICEHKIRPLKLEVFESSTRKGVLPEEVVRRYWHEQTIPSAL